MQNSTARPSVQQDFIEEQCTVELTCSWKDNREDTPPLDIPKATGIYISRGGKKYLATNWHVVSGKHPKSEVQQSEYIPRGLYIGENVLGPDGESVTTYVPLFDRDENPLWLESKKTTIVEGAEQKIDLAIVPVETSLPGLSTFLSTLDQHNNLRPLAMVSVIGYPFHRDRPIWKTAHIAESVQPVKDYFLINGRTKAGMSGSGVFSTTIQQFDKTLKISTRILLGIYSARYVDAKVGQGPLPKEQQLNELDIGIVWKIDLIEKIFKENERSP